MTAFGIERAPAQDARSMADSLMAAAQPWSMGLEVRAERTLDERVERSRDPRRTKPR